MERKDNLVTGILIFSMILILLLTTYFCLDIFGIISVPQKYSIAYFLGNKVSEISVAVDLEEIVTEDNIDEWINARTKVVDNQNERTGGYDNVIIPEIIRPVGEEQETEYNTQQEEVNIKNEDTNNTFNRVYYSQLDVYGKLIYLQFIEHKDELMNGTYTANFGTDFNELLHQENGENILENSFQLSVNSLMFDNPELFYLDITKIYMSTEITTFGPLKTYRVKIGPKEGSNYLSDYFQDLQMLQASINTLEKFRNEFAEQIYGLSDYEKIKRIHDYVIENTEYDQSIERENIYNIYGILMQHNAVCEGYSKAMKYLLDGANIPCIVVCGIGKNSNGDSESHAWNYVKIDDLWYAIDSTWDDPVIVGVGRVSSDIYTRYFLKGSNDFFKDHVEDGNIVNNSNFVYPTISRENYIR
ncbi:MAG: hypothetical protein IKM97_00810 [Clostridia bacterium]|nr:hypothetical protein [Clostridia bacterium]